MSKQIKPLREQCTPEELTRIQALFTKVSLYVDLLDYTLTEVSEALRPYNMSHSKTHQLRKLMNDTSAFVHENSKSLGYSKACEFGDVCDEVKAAVDGLFNKAIVQSYNQAKNDKK